MSTFRARKLFVLVYANGFTMWHYAGSVEDKPKSKDWWYEARDMLRSGDKIVFNYRDDDGNCPYSEDLSVVAGETRNSALTVKAAKDAAPDDE